MTRIKKLALVTVLSLFSALTLVAPATACESHVCYNDGNYVTCCTLQPYTGGGCAYGGCYTYYCDFSAPEPMCIEHQY